jgi:hypothetical protein
MRAHTSGSAESAATLGSVATSVNNLASGGATAFATLVQITAAIRDASGTRADQSEPERPRDGTTPYPSSTS